MYPLGVFFIAVAFIGQVFIPILAPTGQVFITASLLGRFLF